MCVCVCKNIWVMSGNASKWFFSLSHSILLNDLGIMNSTLFYFLLLLFLSLAVFFSSFLHSIILQHISMNSMSIFCDKRLKYWCDLWLPVKDEFQLISLSIALIYPLIFFQSVERFCIFFFSIVCSFVRTYACSQFIEWKSASSRKSARLSQPIHLVNFGVDRKRQSVQMKIR